METGFVAHELILVGNLSPDTGRLGNRLWCFFAPGVTPGESDFAPHPEIEALIYDKSLHSLVLSEPAFSSALNRATILMTVAHGHIALR